MHQSRRRFSERREAIEVSNYASCPLVDILTPSAEPNMVRPNIVRRIFEASNATIATACSYTNPARTTIALRAKICL
jgi:hypothetical protein